MITNPKIAFSKVVRGKNFMTPDILAHEYAGHYVIELSRGAGIGGGLLYGVTVVDMATKEESNELSRCFDTRKEARTYINELAQGKHD